MAKKWIEQADVVLDDSTGALLVSASGGATAANQTTANTALAAIQGQVGAVTLAKSTWVDCGAVLGRIAALVGTTVTSGNTAVGSLYGSAAVDGSSPILLADVVGDQITGRTVTAHTVFDPGGANYQASLPFIKGGLRYLRWQQASQGTDNWAWRIIGL